MLAPAVAPSLHYHPRMTLFGGVHYSPGVPDPDNVSRMDHNALPMIREFHRFGIRVDKPFLADLSSRIDVSKAEWMETIRQHIGDWHYTHPKSHERTPFKIGSRDHLSQLFFEDMKIQGNDPIPRTPKNSRYEVSEEILEPYRSKNVIVGPVIEWHKSDKIQGTYALPLQLWADNDSRVHTVFNATQAATGRLASSKPNLQNIPVRTKLGKEVRKAFIAAPGYTLLSSDFSQIEMVWAAHRSQDPTMMSVFHNAEDLHLRTTCNVFHLDYVITAARFVECEKRLKDGTCSPEDAAWYKDLKQFKRLPCKTVGFGVLYGQTAEGLQASLQSEGIFWTLEECTDFIERKFFEVYPYLKVMLEADYLFATRFGIICDEFGRVRLVPEAKSRLSWISQEGVRKAGNHPEQASAQGSIKIAMARLMSICKQLGPSIIRPLLQIHDQLIFEVRLDWAEAMAEIVKDEMEAATPLTIPVRASSDLGDRWADL